MDRDEGTEKLRKMASIIADVKIDVSPLLPLVDSFINNVNETLIDSVADGVIAERLVSRLREDFVDNRTLSGGK